MSFLGLSQRKSDFFYTDSNHVPSCNSEGFLRDVPEKVWAHIFSIGVFYPKHVYDMKNEKIPIEPQVCGGTAKPDFDMIMATTLVHREKRENKPSNESMDHVKYDYQNMQQQPMQQQTPANYGYPADAQQQYAMYQQQQQMSVAMMGGLNPYSTPISQQPMQQPQPYGGLAKPQYIDTFLPLANIFPCRESVIYYYNKFLRRYSDWFGQGTSIHNPNKGQRSFYPISKRSHFIFAYDSWVSLHILDREDSDGIGVATNEINIPHPKNRFFVNRNNLRVPTSKAKIKKTTLGVYDLAPPMEPLSKDEWKRRFGNNIYFP
jgi:hypothetical protein